MGEIAGFTEELKGLKEYVALATVNAKDYQKTNLEIIKHFVNEEKTPGVYVTLNKPFSAVNKLFKENGVDNRLILFIDAVTRAPEVKKTKECLFIGSPEKLSDISVAMDQAVRSLPTKNKFLFFDSLSTLLIYNKAVTVAKFIHFLAGKMREWGVKGIIISLEKQSDKELIDQLMQFCDIYFDFGVNK
jgi:KaiC/GvpD/RAD55 family RecA-like ATPase